MDIKTYIICIYTGIYIVKMSMKEKCNNMYEIVQGLLAQCYILKLGT